MMTIYIDKFKSLSSELRSHLKRHGFNNSDQILEAVRTPDRCRQFAEQVGLGPDEVLNLANRADLARVRGIGSVFTDLLDQAGVDTVKTLATHDPTQLYIKLAALNDQMELAGRKPTVKAVAGWVAQAKDLPEVVEY